MTVKIGWYWPTCEEKGYEKGINGNDCNWWFLTVTWYWNGVNPYLKNLKKTRFQCDNLSLGGVEKKLKFKFSDKFSYDRWTLHFMNKMLTNIYGVYDFYKSNINNQKCHNFSIKWHNLGNDMTWIGISDIYTVRCVRKRVSRFIKILPNIYYTGTYRGKSFK